MTIQLWMIPTIITVVGIIWAIYSSDDAGWLAGFDMLIKLIPVLAISLISWIVYAIIK